MQAIITKGDDPGDDEAEGGLIELAATGAAGERLDRFLARAMPQYSRTRLQRWIDQGAVRWDERVLGRRHRLSGIERIQVEPQAAAADQAFGPEPVEFEVLYEDEELIVVDKRPGLVVHPAAGNWHGTLLNGLLHRFPAQTVLPRAGIVHRLDKDTSGLMVVARTESAMARLGDQLADRSMGRRYLALVQGEAAPVGEIDAPIGRDPSVRTRMAVTEHAGSRSARTAYRTLASGRLGARAVSLLECRLFTGRTHQIRVHLGHIGLPIVGDETYGGIRQTFCPRQALHAWRLALKHPGDGRPVHWNAPLPADFCALLVAVGLDLGAALRLAQAPFGDST